MSKKAAAKSTTKAVGDIIPYLLPPPPAGNPVPPSPGIPAPKEVKPPDIIRPLIVTSVNEDGTVNGQVILEPNERGHVEKFVRNVKP